MTDIMFFVMNLVFKDIRKGVATGNLVEAGGKWVENEPPS
jgi:hypothetical protein